MKAFFSYGTAKGLVAVLAMTVATQCGAQTVSLGYEYRNLISAASNTAAAGGGEFGESVSDYSGATVFAHEDVAIPGNNGMRVSLGRRFAVEDKYGVEELGGFGDWDIDVPYVGGIFADDSGWTVAQTAPNKYKRCSIASTPYVAGGWLVSEVWSGYKLHVPGEPPAQLIAANGSFPNPSDGLLYPWIVEGMGRVSCLAATQNGYEGEGFRLLTPDGTRYDFNWAVELNMRGIKKSEARFVGRKQVLLLATRVEDRFGNWVAYGYSGKRLANISSSDGRSISLSYSGDRVSSASAAGRTWSYAYSSGGKLEKVTLPDGSFWQFSSAGNLSAGPGPATPQLDDWDATCDEPDPSMRAYTFQVKHPSDALGVFSFQQERHYRSQVPWQCNMTPPMDIVLQPDESPSGELEIAHVPSYDWLAIPNYFDAFSLKSTVVTGPGILAATTTRSYGWVNPFGFCGRPPILGCMDACLVAQGCTTPDGKWVVITEPDGAKVRKLLGVRYGTNEGRLLAEQRVDPLGSTRREVQYSYITDAESATQAFAPSLGASLSADPMIGKVRPVNKIVTMQDGATFTLSVETGCGGANVYCFDAFARPKNVRRYSTVSP